MEFIYLPTSIKQVQGLAKKYLSIKKDIVSLIKQLEKLAVRGNEIGKSC